MKQLPITLPDQPGPRERKAEYSIVWLYLVFFCLWSLGLLLGLWQTGGDFFGFPLWFFVSCILAYTAICLLLAWTVRRFFR